MKYFLIAGIFIASLFGAHVAHAATLSLQPSSGTFSVGSIFEISLYLDTQGATVNAIEALLQFSPDKLQVVSPAAGQSIIDLWVGQPRYNNSNGTIDVALLRRGDFVLNASTFRGRINSHLALHIEKDGDTKSTAVTFGRGLDSVLLLGNNTIINISEVN